MNLESMLQETWGHPRFRTGQHELIVADLESRDILAVMPTGAGKSLCFQFPAVASSTLTVVVSPLISLMHDQQAGLKRAGVNALYFSHLQSRGDQYVAQVEAIRNPPALLYVSPERFVTADFGRFLKQLPARRVVFDEAHCLCEYVEFRPAYRRAATAAADLGLCVSAFTATATPHIEEEILKATRARDPFVVRTGFNRPNLQYSVMRKSQWRAGMRTEQIVAEMVGELTGQGIVYRTTRQGVEDTAAELCRAGVLAAPYHAGMAASARHYNQRAFLEGQMRVIVGTIAFGLGINKPDIRWVIHGELSKSLEGYYQETGRAGRDGEPAWCCLLYDVGDVPLVRSFVDGIVDDELRQVWYKSLVAMKRYAETDGCRREFLLHYFEWRYGEGRPAVTCGNCDNCRRKARVHA